MPSVPAYLRMTLQDRTLVLLIKTLDLTKPLPNEIPLDVRVLIENRLRKTLQTIENWLIKTFVSKGVTLPSGKRHGMHVHGDSPQTPQCYYRYSCYWFGKKHGLIYHDMDIDPPEYLNYYLDVEHGPFLYPVNQSGGMKRKDYEYGECTHEKYIDPEDDDWDDRFDAIMGTEETFLITISRVPVLRIAGRSLDHGY